MRIALASAFAAALVSMPASDALAASCTEMRAQHEAGEIWTCRLSYNSGSSARTKTECFLEPNEGFAWMGRESGRAAGQITQGNCRNQNQTLRYRDWLRQQG